MKSSHFFILAFVATLLASSYVHSAYLDTQPEFAQSWADFAQPPGYLPNSYRNSFSSAQQQYRTPTTGGYGSAPQPYGGINNPQSIGFGYVNSIGPTNPASFYVQIQPPYYYRIPPQSPFYLPTNGGLFQNKQHFVPPLAFRGPHNGPYNGYKRSLSQMEVAPYQMLVDHLAAAASDVKEIFTNVSTIECPSKPSDYTCPQMLTSLNKEELKKKLCDYETVLTGSITLVPDTEKAQTRCGALSVQKQDAKNEDEISELPEKMAIVLGKDCQLKSIVDGQANKDLFYMLVKTSIPSGTKFILADGSNIDLVSSQTISKEELSSLMKQCPKQVTPAQQQQQQQQQQQPQQKTAAQ